MHRMDDLDVRIFKELGSPSSPQWNVRETYSKIAKRIGVDEETVRRRLKRAEKLGSFPGWLLMLNPRLIGCEAAGIDLEVNVEEEKEKEQVIAELKSLQGIIKILDFRGKGLQLTLYYPNDEFLRSKTKLICERCNASAPIVWRMAFPRAEIRMTETDWKILDAMLSDARKSLFPVSEELGISTRTVERRLTAISEARAVYLQGTPNFRAYAGLSCVFLVHCPDKQQKRVVDDIVLAKARRVDLSNTIAKQHSTFVMVYDNLSEADDTLKWIRSLEGVALVRMGIMKELIAVQDWMRKEIRSRITKGAS